MKSLFAFFLSLVCALGVSGQVTVSFGGLNANGNFGPELTVGIRFDANGEASSAGATYANAGTYSPSLPQLVSGQIDQAEAFGHSLTLTFAGYIRVDAASGEGTEGTALLRGIQGATPLLGLTKIPAAGNDVTRFDGTEGLGVHFDSSALPPSVRVRLTAIGLVDVNGNELSLIRLADQTRFILSGANAGIYDLTSFGLLMDGGLTDQPLLSLWSGSTVGADSDDGIPDFAITSLQFDLLAAPVAVPEPSTLVLLLAGVALAGFNAIFRRPGLRIWRSRILPRCFCVPDRCAAESRRPPASQIEKCVSVPGREGGYAAELHPACLLSHQPLHHRHDY